MARRDFAPPLRHITNRNTPAFTRHLPKTSHRTSSHARRHSARHHLAIALPRHRVFQQHRKYTLIAGVARCRHSPYATTTSSERSAPLPTAGATQARCSTRSPPTEPQRSVAGDDRTTTMSVRRHARRCTATCGHITPMAMSHRLTRTVTVCGVTQTACCCRPNASKRSKRPRRRATDAAGDDARDAPQR